MSSAKYSSSLPLYGALTCGKGSRWSQRRQASRSGGANERISRREGERVWEVGMIAVATRALLPLINRLQWSETEGGGGGGAAAAEKWEDVELTATKRREDE